MGDRFNVSPVDVLEWPEDMVRDALQIMAAEGRWHDRNRPRPT